MDQVTLWGTKKVQIHSCGRLLPQAALWRQEKVVAVAVVLSLLQYHQGNQESGEESGLFYEQSGARGLPSGLGSGSSGSGTSGFFSGEESSLPSGLGSGISGSGTSGFLSGEELSGSGFSGVSFINTEMIYLTASPSGEQELSGVSPFELTDVSGFGSASGSAIGSGTIIDFASGSAIGFGSGSASGASGYPSHPSGEVSGPIQSQDGKIVILTDDEVELAFRPTIGTEQGRGSVEISGEGSSQEHYAEDLSISLLIVLHMKIIGVSMKLLISYQKDISNLMPSLRHLMWLISHHWTVHHPPLLYSLLHLQLYYKHQKLWRSLL